MYDNWTRAQKLRWYWSWASGVAFYCVIFVFVFSLLHRNYPGMDPHLEVLIEQGLSLPLAGLFGFLFFRSIISKHITERPSAAQSSRVSSRKSEITYVQTFALGLLLTCGVIGIASQVATWFGYDGRYTFDLLGVCIAISFGGCWRLWRLRRLANKSK